MNIITGEKFQSLCDHYISKELDSEVKLKGTTESEKYLDIESFDFTDFDNKEMVYCNSGLVSATKQKLIDLKLFDKLQQFKNPFKLILHNSDQRFYEKQLEYLDIPNCKKIYTQNMDVVHDDVIPLPIGVANSCWKWGNLDIFDEVLNTDIDTKSNFIYANFTKTGGVRDENRLECYENIESQNIPFVENLEYRDYLNKLKTYKYCVSPQGNGIDCHRMWEALYLKVVPICIRSKLISHFSTLFPIYIVDRWEDLDVKVLEKSYSKFNWDNYKLLDFEKYIKHIGLKWAHNI